MGTLERACDEPAPRAIKEEVMTVKEVMITVILDIPSCGEYETDARDTWPRRWEELEKRLVGWSPQRREGNDGGKRC